MLALSLAAICAQVDRALEFEVASVKPTQQLLSGVPPGPLLQGGPGTRDPLRISYRNVPLPLLIALAYEVSDGDVVGPDWATKVDFITDKHTFDIEARLPPGASKEQLRLMLQSLLAERFALKTHWEKKEAPAYALVLAKGGPKFQESPPAPAGADPNVRVNLFTPGTDGFPATPPGYSGMFVHPIPGHTRAKFIRYSLDEFAKWTRTNSGRPSINSTGLTGRYDFYLDYGNDLPDPKKTESRASDILDQGAGFMSALQTQLGLRLIPTQAKVDVLVIDHVERVPTEN